MKKINIAIVGSGMIAAATSKTIMEVTGLPPYAIYSRTYEKGKEFADNNQIALVYTDFEKMLEDKNINFVYIASPNSLHFTQAKKALLANKNVILEKPFTSNYKECEELINIANEKELFLFEAIRIIHTDNFKLIKKKLPLLGKIKYVNITFLQRSSRYDALLKGQEPNAFSLKYSGGSLMDLGVYNLYFALGMFNEPIDIKYEADKYINGIDLGGTIILDYQDFKVYACARKDCAAKNFIEIVGENAYIYTNGGPGDGLEFDLVIGKDSQHFNTTMFNHSFLYDEFKQFIEIYNNNDINKANELLNNTKSIMKMLDKARHSANIIFESEKE